MPGQPHNYPTAEGSMERMPEQSPQANPGLVPVDADSYAAATRRPASYPAQPRPQGASARPAPRLDQRIRRETHGVIMGNPQGARFLARQLLANTAAEQINQVNEAIAEGRPVGPTRHIVNVNFRQRQLDSPENLRLPPGSCVVSDLDPFGEDGALEKLMRGHPERVDHILATSLAGGDERTRVTYEALLGYARNDITVPGSPPPGLEQLKDAIGFYNGARVNTDDATYPDDPSSLDDAQLKSLRENANTKRLSRPAMADHVADLHMRLETDVLRPLSSQPQTVPGHALLPVAGLGSASTTAHVGVTRMTVNQESTPGRLDAEVRALGATTLMVVTQEGANGITVPRLQIEGADVLLKRDPETFRLIVSACHDAQPPIPVTLTFGEITEQALPYLTGGKTVCGDLTQQSPDAIVKVLPAEPVWDEAGVSDNTGSNDGINTGQTTNMGYNPEDTRINGGTSATAGMALGTSWSRSTNYTKVVRPPRPDELTQNVGEWQAVHYAPDGTCTGVYDLRTTTVNGARLLGGRQIRDRLRIKEVKPSEATPDKIAEIERRMQAMRAAKEEYGTMRNTDGLPGMPSQPKAPVSSRQRAEVPKLPMGQQFRELAAQASNGRSYAVTMDLLVGPGIDLYLATADPALVAHDQAEAGWVDFARVRNIKPRDAQAAWRRRWR